jgi:prepilin-type N-terminal cleavage/methylation domain-containing protein
LILGNQNVEKSELQNRKHLVMKSMTRRSTQRGFTLAELAIVMLIIALILGGILIPLGTQVQSKRIADTQKTIEEIKEALIGFAVINKRLPGPAISATNGIEKGACAVPVTCTGFIPWTTLGVNKFDAWGKMIRYSVTPSFTSSSTTFTITTAGDKTVRTRDSAGALVDQAINVPVVLISSGAKNTGYLETGTLLPDSSTTNLDEETNTAVSSQTTFISRIATDVTSTGGGEFDDIVTWIPTTILINRMVTAGQLP